MQLDRWEAELEVVTLYLPCKIGRDSSNDTDRMRQEYMVMEQNQAQEVGQVATTDLL